MHTENYQTEQSHEDMIDIIINYHFGESPIKIDRSPIGICNEVYSVQLNNQAVIVRLSPTAKYLRGSQVHIPEFKALKINVPDILAEDYSQSLIPFCYQIQNKMEGQDLGALIESLTNTELKALAREIATIFKKVKTLPVTPQFGVIWGGDNDVSDSWSERMKIWIEESLERGHATGVMDNEIEQIAANLFDDYNEYFDSVKPTMYYGDICSKNVMIHAGVFSGLVDLDGLTQGDFLEALGRIKLSWYGTPYGEIYTNTIMDELILNTEQRRLVTMYALLNQISWACENGIQFNQNTKPIVNWEKARKDKVTIMKLASELNDKSAIKNLIGDYNAFFSDLLHRMQQAGITIKGLPISHLLYRTTTLPEYEHLRDELKSHCSEFVETQFNDRAVSILILKNPLLLEGGFTVSMIELPAPRAVHMYPGGLESIGVVVGKALAGFIKQHEAVLSGVKDHGQHCQPAFITFENDKTVKFYDISLRDIVLLQGWEIELLKDSHSSKLHIAANA